MKLNSPQISERLQDIKMLILDVDGVMTDGGIFIDENGIESKRFNAKDGVGIKALIESGIDVGIISAAYSNKIVLKRAEMLGIKHCYVGKENKGEIVSQWSEKLQIPLKNMAYIGDDIIDYEIIKLVGISACPSDSHNSIIDEVDIVLNKKGGKGCVREFIDLLL